MTDKEFVNAVYKEGQVLIPSDENASPLLDGGYGVRREGEEGSTLSPWEALYLVAEDRITVSNAESSEPLNFQSLLDHFRRVDDEVWVKFLIYRDLRSRGYVVRDGFGLGVDFRLYARGAYGKKAAKYLVYAIREGVPIPTKKLEDTLTIAQNMKKQLIIAVMDRRGEIVYYSLGSFNI